MDILIIALTLAGLYMAWNIGANDLANAMGTSVGTGSLSIKQVVIIAAVFELLVTVSFVAMFYRIVPTLLAAVLSALIWNFFFIKPYYTFHIGNTEDKFMFFMYFVIVVSLVISIARTVPILMPE